MRDDFGRVQRDDGRDRRRMEQGEGSDRRQERFLDVKEVVRQAEEAP